MKISHFLILLLGVTQVLTAAAASPAIESVKNIEETAINFLKGHYSAAFDTAESSNIKIALGQVDPRLRLQKCSTPLTGFIPQGSDLKGNTVVGVRCVGDQSWHIYVPATIEIFQPTVVFTRNLSRGHVITAKDLTVKPIEVSRLRVTTVQRIKQIVGSQLKQQVLAGQVAALKSACMVCKGDKLVVSAESSSFSVSMEGLALEDGHFGEAVRVRNVTSSRVIRGIVVASKTVSVNLMVSKAH